jgi:hypothetical protein
VHPQITSSTTRKHSDDRPRDVDHPRVRTDGGTSATTEPTDHSDDRDAESRQSRFQSLFVELTGTEEVVERQHPDSPSRLLEDADENGGISDYLTDIARDDGLSDTQSNPEPD